MAKGPDWNDIHRTNPGAVRDALTEPDIPFATEEAAKASRGNGLDAAGERLEVNSEGFYRNRPQSEGQKPELPPPPDRASLTVSAWLDKDIPERDFLLGGVMCTTSRWFIFGETGIGKTLVAMELAAAIAGAAAFLKWPGQRRVRVMYLDGELPTETFKERMELIASRHGKDIEFYGYNREDLGDDGLPPLNTEAGQAWLKREIAAIKPDLIIFDSIMCLLIGSMSEEATWMPVRPFVRWLSAQRIAQVWLHHANDFGKSFGDKTREWEMEAVIKLSKVEGDETAVLFDGDPSPCSDLTGVEPGTAGSNRRVFSVSTVAGTVPILPRVSSPANASATIRDAKRLGVGRERSPRGLHAQRPGDRQSRSLENMRDAGFSRSLFNKRKNAI
jgi:hypothetical protein